MGRPKTIEDTDLLRHARDEFLRKGSFGSTKEIAKRAGVSEAILYRRYPTKSALFLAAMMPPELDLASIMAPARDAADPRRALTAIGKNMLAYFHDLIPVVMHLVTNPAIRLQDILAHFRIAPAPALVDAVAGYLVAARLKGRVSVDNPQAAAALLVASVHSLAQFELLGVHGGAFPQETIGNLVDALWRGLAPPREAGPKSTRSRQRAPRRRS